MHYFVDGYNVIRSADWLGGGSLRDQRERLLRFIEDKRPHGSANNQVTVVFDGRADVSGPPESRAVRVIFSHGGDADSVIKASVDELTQPRDAVVVTNDRAIQRWVRGVGARVLSCEEFLAAASPRVRRRAFQDKVDEDTARDINEELKDRWKLP
jgi:predicted RNA-binding protein with PIN domain